MESEHKNAVSTNVLEDKQFIDLESNPTGTSRAVKNLILSIKKTLFGLTSIPSKHLNKTSDHQRITTEHESLPFDDMDVLVPLLILQCNCSLTDL